VQQLSLPLPPGPQLLRPAPPGEQLGGAPGDALVEVDPVELIAAMVCAPPPGAASSSRPVRPPHAKGHEAIVSASNLDAFRGKPAAFVGFTEISESKRRGCRARLRSGTPENLDPPPGAIEPTPSGP
jgi:hypothetical protein